MFDKIIEKTIKNHCKEREELSKFNNRLKVVSIAFRDAEKCYDGITIIRFDAVCAFKAPQFENNRVKFTINIYDNPKGDKINTIGVYFDGTFYSAAR